MAEFTEGALSDLRIVEFDGLGPVPFAGMLFADMGADIVRVVRPSASPNLDGVDRGRRIVRADLRAEADRDAVLQIILNADVLIEGFRPGVLERLGFDPAMLLSRHPGLVIGRMTGWGQTGELSSSAGHDINQLALTGVLAAIGEPAGPSIPLNLVADYAGGSLYLVTGVLAAVLHARRTGRGQVIDCAMCDGAASLMTVVCGMRARGQWRLERGANLLDGAAPFYTTYRCADGRHIAVGAIEPQFYGELLRILGLSNVTEFADQHDRTQWPLRKARLQSIFGTRTRNAWSAAFAGVDACVTPVLDLEEAAQHPHLVERGTYAGSGTAPAPAPAPRFSTTRAVARPSQEVQSTAEITGDWERTKSSPATPTG